MKAAPLFAGIGGHHSARSRTDEWLTPPSLIDALGGAASFDLDPCAPIDRPWPTARHHLTVVDNGLIQPWDVTEHFVEGKLCECPCHCCAAPNAGLSYRPTNSHRVETGEAFAGLSANATRAAAPESAGARAFGSEASTSASNVRGSSRQTETALRQDTADALAAEGYCPSTSSLREKGDIVPAGADLASECMPANGPRESGAKIQTQSAPQRSDTVSPKRGESGSVSGRSSTITPVANGELTPHSSGRTNTGVSRSHLGSNDAPIATGPRRSNKITSGRSATQPAQGPFPGTSFPHAAPATEARAQNALSLGSPTRRALVESCPICKQRGCVSRSRPARVFLNPPYSKSVIGQWLARMADHNRGVALIFARTETDAFFRSVWERASALLFMRGRINFHLVDGRRAQGNAGGPTVLCAYGRRDADILAMCGIDGQFVPLRLPRIIAIAGLQQT